MHEIRVGSELQRSCFIIFISKVLQYVVEKQSCTSLENLCIKDVQEAPSSAERHRGKKIRKFILIFQLYFKMSGSSEVSIHMVLIIPCH